MKRTLLVIALAIAALALLVAAALKSQSIPVETHVARYTLDSDLTNLENDFDALVSSLETARQSSRAPGEAADALRKRIEGSIESLEERATRMPGSTLQRERIENVLDRMRATLAVIEELTSALLQEQTQYADNLTVLRDDGPEIVQQLRAIGQDQIAADLFQLMAETIDFAAPGGRIGDYEISRLLATLNRDQRIDPVLAGLAGPLLARVDLILQTKDTITSRLTQLRSVALAENTDALSQAANAAYQSAVSSVDSARMMLLVYAAVMLASVAFVGFRLRSSYSDLNRANAELAVLNESLEQRVHERTEDLSEAMDELKESQVQLVQAEKMSSLGQLVAGISHEINTPLLYLANNASLIQERMEALRDFVSRCAATLTLDPADFQDRQEFQSRLLNGLKNLKFLLRENEIEASIEEIVDLNRDSVDGLSDLTEMAQSLKDFSRLDRAPVDSFDVNLGLDKTLNIARNIIKHKAEVRKRFATLPSIECSPSKINQVFLNLLTNAAQSIEEHGEIVITTSMKDDDHVIVSIADTGCGIPEENLERIRDPFFTTKEVGSGTGLGLSIVDEIVRSHGGELIVDSTLGEGSTFSVVLPVRHTPTDTGETQSEAAVNRLLAEAV